MELNNYCNLCKHDHKGKTSNPCMWCVYNPLRNEDNFESDMEIKFNDSETTGNSN